MAHDTTIRVYVRDREWLNDRALKIAQERRAANQPGGGTPSTADVVHALIERIMEWEAGETP